MDRRTMVQLLLPLLIGLSLGALPEELHYACTRAGKIQVMNEGLATYKSLYARENDNTCSVNRTIGGETFKFVIYGCNVMNPVKVTLMEEDQETLGGSIIFGGKGVVGYDLQCNGVPVGGSETVLHAKLQAGETGYEYKSEHQAVLELKMQIKENDIVQTTSSPVKVGTPLNVTISGSNDFRFTVKSCLAEGLKGQVKVLIQEGKTLDSAIITDFTALAPALEVGRMETEALLYAFHFVGSEEITLNCTLFTCRLHDTTCLTLPGFKTGPSLQFSLGELLKMLLPVSISELPRTIYLCKDCSLIKVCLRTPTSENEDNSARTDSLEAGIRVVDEYYYPTSSGRVLKFLPGYFIVATVMYFLLG